MYRYSPGGQQGLAVSAPPRALLPETTQAFEAHTPHGTSCSLYLQEVLKEREKGWSESLLPEGGGGEVTLETTSKNFSGKEVSIWSSKFVFSWPTLAGVIHFLFIFSPYFYYWIRNAGVWTPGPALRGAYWSPPLTFWPVKLHSWGPASISERPEEVLERGTDSVACSPLLQAFPGHAMENWQKKQVWGGGTPVLPPSLMSISLAWFLLGIESDVLPS